MIPSLKKRSSRTFALARILTQLLKTLRQFVHFDALLRESGFPPANNLFRRAAAKCFIAQLPLLGGNRFTQAVKLLGDFGSLRPSIYRFRILGAQIELRARTHRASRGQALVSDG